MNTMPQLIPVGTNLLVQKIDSFKGETKLVLTPDSLTDKSPKALVIAAGPGDTSPFGVHMKPAAKAGDLVYLVPNMGTIEVIDNGKTLFLVQSAAIACIYIPDGEVALQS